MLMSLDDPEGTRAAAYPPAQLTPAEFEGWVAELYAAVAPEVEDLRVTQHEVVEGVDGTYDFDATARFRWGGIDFLVLIEAKRHRNSIKRELVASLHSKMLGTGAQKAVMFATAPYQSGAIQFAKVHGIALVEVTEGRFTYLTRGADPMPPMSRQEAADRFDLPTFVGFAVEAVDDRTTGFSIVSTAYPDRLTRVLLGELFTPGSRGG
jgi:hypothetical protein